MSNMTKVSLHVKYENNMLYVKYDNGMLYVGDDIYGMLYVKMTSACFVSFMTK